MNITERIEKYLNEGRMEKAQAIPANIKRKINKDISMVIKPTYFDKIPLDEIFDVLKKYDIVVLQEDGRPWEGFLTGGINKTEQVHFDLGWTWKKDNRGYHPVIPNANLQLSYYKMESGRFEIISYIG